MQTCQEQAVFLCLLAPSSDYSGKRPSYIMLSSPFSVCLWYVLDRKDISASNCSISLLYCPSCCSNSWWLFYRSFSTEICHSQGIRQQSSHYLRCRYGCYIWTPFRAGKDSLQAGTLYRSFGAEASRKVKNRSLILINGQFRLELPVFGIREWTL